MDRPEGHPELLVGGLPKEQSDLLVQIMHRVLQYTQLQDKSAVLSAEANEEAAKPSSVAKELLGGMDLPTAYSLAWLYWCQYLSLPEPSRHEKLMTAVKLFSRVAGRVDLNQIPESIVSQLQHSSPATRNEHAISAFRIFQETGNSERLDEAIALFKRAVEEAEDDPPGPVPRPPGPRAS